MAKDKDIHVDLLAIDLQEGHWLKPKPSDVLSQEQIDAIRKKHRDKYLAEKNKQRPK